MSGGSASSRAERTLLGSLSARVARFAGNERMFRRVTKVLVGVSGGPDSLASLLILRRLSASFGFEIVVAHFDHQLREDSAADLAYVRSVCERLAVPCRTGEGDVRAVARQQKLGIEAAARDMRYQFLAFVAEREAADCVVTGHTSDDQAETVLMHIVRGTGVRGLRGMTPVATVPGSALRLVRPLLCLSREDTAALCREDALDPIQDPANSDLAFTRNRLRHETLLALQRTNPSVKRSLLGLSESARQVFAGIERESFRATPQQRDADGSTFAASSLRDLGNEALILVIEREAAFFHLRADINRTRVENLRTVLARGAGLVRFGEVEVEVSCGHARVGPQLEAGGQEAKPVTLNVPGSTLIGQARVDVSTSPFSGQNATVVLDAGSVSGVLRVRPVVAGDRFLAGGHERKLSDLLIDAKVPRWQRRGLLAIADSRGLLAIPQLPSLGPQAPAPEAALYIRVVPLRQPATTSGPRG